jgi:hypothetical protein
VGDVGDVCQALGVQSREHRLALLGAQHLAGLVGEVQRNGGAGGGADAENRDGEARLRRSVASVAGRSRR